MAKAKPSQAESRKLNRRLQCDPVRYPLSPFESKGPTHICHVCNATWHNLGLTFSIFVFNKVFPFPIYMNNIIITHLLLSFYLSLSFSLHGKLLKARIVDRVLHRRRGGVGGFSGGGGRWFFCAVERWWC